MSLTFFDVTAESLYKNFIENLQKETGEKMYEGDERLIQAQCLLTVIVSLFNMFNEAAKARMLQYAYGEILDAIGEFKDCKRLASSKARCTVRFTMTSAKNVAVEIPKGTRVTADGGLIFETVENCVIPVDNLSVTVEAMCTKGGKIANGIPVGAISTMIDNVTGVTGCTNTTATYGGDDGEPYPYDADKYPEGDNGEGDERYRERIKLSNAAYSTAGSENGYIYWAKTASADITDVKVISDQVAGTVELVIMTKDGEPTEEIIEKVLDVCSATDVRPMNDIVTVTAPEVMEYDIEIKYTIMDGNQSKAIASISGENGAATRFDDYTSARLGRDINPDLLKLYCMEAGYVYSCEIVKPVLTELNARQLAKWSGKITLHEPSVKFGE